MLDEVISELKIIQGINNDVGLSWQVDSDVILPTDVFELRYGNSPSDMQVLEAVLDTNYYKHVDVNLFNKLTRHYYQIAVKRLVAGPKYIVVYETQIYPLNASITNPIALEIQRRKAMVNKFYRNNKGYILVKKTFGERCDSCYDEHYESASNSNCPVCFNTTYKGGFFPKIEIGYEMGIAEETFVATENEKVVPIQKNFTIIGFPIVSPGDLFVDRNNQRWRVESINGKGILDNNVVSQTMTCSMIAYNSVENRIEV